MDLKLWFFGCAKSNKKIILIHLHKLNWINESCMFSVFFGGVNVVPVAIRKWNGNSRVTGKKNLTVTFPRKYDGQNVVPRAMDQMTDYQNDSLYSIHRQHFEVDVIRKNP